MSGLAVAPEDAPDKFPTEFGAVATVVIGVATTSAQGPQLVSLLCAAIDVTPEQGDDASRMFLVTDERPAGPATTRAPARWPRRPLFCFAPKSPCWSAVSPGFTRLNPGEASTSPAPGASALPARRPAPHWPGRASRRPRRPQERLDEDLWRHGSEPRASSWRSTRPASESPEGWDVEPVGEE